MPFLCLENAPQKCKWLQCVRLVINKRRPSADVAAAPQRHPRASRAGADQAHTLPRANRPLNCSIFYRTKATKTLNSFAGRKARRGAEPSPLNRSGSAAAFPRLVRFLSALSDSLPFHAFCFSVLCSSPPDFAFSVGYGSIGLRGSQRPQNRC